MRETLPFSATPAGITVASTTDVGGATATLLLTYTRH